MRLILMSVVIGLMAEPANAQSGRNQEDGSAVHETRGRIVARRDRKATRRLAVSGAIRYN